MQADANFTMTGAEMSCYSLCIPFGYVTTSKNWRYFQQRYDRTII